MKVCCNAYSKNFRMVIRRSKARKGEGRKQALVKANLHITVEDLAEEIDVRIGSISNHLHSNRQGKKAG